MDARTRPVAGFAGPTNLSIQGFADGDPTVVRELYGQPVSGQPQKVGHGKNYPGHVSLDENEGWVMEGLMEGFKEGLMERSFRLV